MTKKFLFTFMLTLFFSGVLNAADAPVVGFINEAFKERHELSRKMWNAEDHEQWPKGFLEVLWPQVDQPLMRIRDFLLLNSASATFGMLATGNPDERDLPGLNSFLDEVFTNFKAQAEDYLKEKVGAIVRDYISSDEESSATSSPVTVPTLDDDLGIFNRFLENRKKSFHAELNRFVSRVRNIQVFDEKKPLAQNFGLRSIRWHFIAGELITDTEILTTYLVAHKILKIFGNKSLLTGAADEDAVESAPSTDSKSDENPTEKCEEVLGIAACELYIDECLLRDLINRFLQLQKEEKTLTADDALHNVKVKQQQTLNAIAKTFDVLRKTW
jgi:hypothetical protein